MKISKIFHWLYFTVMMLPCVIIPIFAIYTRNENYNSNIEVQVEQSEIVNFNQLVQNGNFNNGTSWTLNSAIATYENNICTFTANAQGGGLFEYSIPAVENHKVLFKCDIKTTSLTTEFAIGPRNNYVNIQASTNWQNIATISNAVPNTSGVVFVQIVDRRTSSWDSVQVKNVQLFDLTQMFGSGNEPTIAQFNDYFVNNYYDYTLSYNVLVPNVIVNYNDTDVGSQFIYTLYNATDKYFNFDNFFGLDNVYSWIKLNWFSGNAPLGFAIFWHFFTYWLLSSLAWLLFDLMVYVPLYIHRWLDKGAIE